MNEATFPETPQEALGRFVGISETTGAAISFKILTEDMKVITRSVVRTATKAGPYQNLRANNRAPTLAPKPVTHNLNISGQQEEIIVETIDEEEIDDEKPSPVTNTAYHDELKNPDIETQEQEKKEPDINTDPELAKKAFFRLAMEDAIKHGRSLPTYPGENVHHNPQ